MGPQRMRSVDVAFAASVERIEAVAWAELQRAVPAEVRDRFGIEVRNYDGAVALLAPHADVAAINRIIGLGFEVPLRRELLDAIIGDYALAGVRRMLIQWSPVAAPAEAPKWFAERGSREATPTVKLYRPTDPEATFGSSTFEIVEIGPAEAAMFEATVAAELGVPAPLGPGVRSTLGHAGWRYYLARDEGRPVAGAALFARGELAWCGLGATLAGYRNRGAHTALLVRRIRDAATMGCVWVTADTAEDTAERPNPSYRNMRRVGFEVLYSRANYVLPVCASTP